MGVAHSYCYTVWQETFEGENFLQIGEKYNFRGENVCRLLAFTVPKDTTHPNFAAKAS